VRSVEHFNLPTSVQLQAMTHTMQLMDLNLVRQGRTAEISS
jgi:hypothetical protein